MEALARKTLHPLLTVAAISVTVFSAVGVAALTGVLPHSIGSSKEAAPAALVAAPAPLVAAPDITASTAVAAKPDAAPMPPAAAHSTPRPVHKKVAKAPKPVQIAEAPQAVPAPQTAPVAPAPVVEAPKPVPAGILGVVESVREIKRPQKTNGSGPILGGIAGAVAGNQVGRGNGNNVATILGAVGGIVAGTAVERNVRATKHWEVNVRLDDGSTHTINSDVQPFWHGGERVRLLDGKLQPA